ncbi:MAG TPA: redoxin domain-containing protein [Burkholderiales bacterium]
MRAWPLVFGVLALSAGVSAAELRVGDVAPDFVLPATDGKTYRLADFRGREAVVLAWFPKAYTYGCTIECRSLAESGHLLKQFRVAYFMASVDPLETNKSFGLAQGADFPLLSDATKTTARAYGVLNAAGVANRHTFYIGLDGRITAIDRDINPATSAADIAATLARLGVPRRDPDGRVE